MKDLLPLDALCTAMERGETGSLSVHRAGWGSAEVYVAEGQIRGAETPADGARVLARLQARGLLRDEESAPLVRSLQGDGAVDMLAGRIPEHVVQDVLKGCFHQVLLDALFEPASHRFVAASQVQPVHLQVGHDSRGLLEGLSQVHAAIAPWRSDWGLLLRPGTADSTITLEARTLLELCASPKTLAQLVEASPWFEGRTLTQVADMVAQGLLVVETSVDVPAFADHTAGGRGLGQGRFSSPIRDRVSLAPAAPALRADSPRLDDAELARKISVASDVLRSMVRAMDAAAEDGQAQIQLVMDAAPLHLRPLFVGVQIERDGRLDEGAITHNLRSRLPTEQRQLLQLGLRDLLDRALNRCMESLPEAPGDTLLGRVVGYQKRLGR